MSVDHYSLLPRVSGSISECTVYWPSTVYRLGTSLFWCLYRHLCDLPGFFGLSLYTKDLCLVMSLNHIFLLFMKSTGFCEIHKWNMVDFMKSGRFHIKQVLSWYQADFLKSDGLHIKADGSHQIHRYHRISCNPTGFH